VFPDRLLGEGCGHGKTPKRARAEKRNDKGRDGTLERLRRKIEDE